MNTVEQLCGHLVFAPEQIGPTDGADEQGIAGNDEPRQLAATHIGHQQADAVRRMPGRMQHLDIDVAKIE